MRIALFAVLFTTTLAFAQAPVVTSISPSSGPDTGGTTVRITGHNLSAGAVCILPCPPRVTFGDVTVDATEESDQSLLAVTPAHAAGTVDVTIAVTAREPVVAPGAFTFTAGQQSTWEEILLPVYLDAPVAGGYGSQWSTDFWIRNNGTSAVQLAPWTCPKDMACPGVFPLTVSLEPGRSLHNPEGFAVTSRNTPARMLYVPNDRARDAAMSLRVRDRSRATLNAGTDLPVVRQAELLTRTAELFDVPLNGASFRVLLRVYETAYTDATFAVRVYPQSDEIEAPIQGLTLKTVAAEPGPFRAEPAYAQYDLTSILQLPQVFPDAVRIEIEPLKPGSRFWAVVSITNNETQLVTLVTPQ